MDLASTVKRSIATAATILSGNQGYRDRAHNPSPHKNNWLRYRYGRMPRNRRPAVDYYNNHWIPPYEIPLEPYYYPGYNIIEYPVPPVRYYWPRR